MESQDNSRLVRTGLARTGLQTTRQGSDMKKLLPLTVHQRKVAILSLLSFLALC